MLSLELIRKEPDYVRGALLRRGEEAPLDRLLALDRERRQLIHRADNLRARRREASREIGRNKEGAQGLIEEVRQLSGEIEALEREVKRLEEEIEAVLLSLPLSLIHI